MESRQGFRLVSRSGLNRDMAAFLVDRQARGHTSGTVAFYRKKLKTWRRLFESLGVSEVLGIEPGHIRGALATLADEGHNQGGIHALWRALRTFLRWYADEYEPSDWRNPIVRVVVSAPRDQPLTPVPMSDLAALLATCSGKTLSALRDRAILLSLLDSGARASEFVALDIEDLDTNTGAVAIRHGKNGKSRTVFLGAKSRRAVLSYLRKRGNPDHGPLWGTLEGGRLTYSGLRWLVIRRAGAAGVPTPSLHSFRRAFALACLRNGVDIISLQRLLGHADLSVIRRYLAQTTDDLAEAHKRGGPVDRLL